jgi:hypothetical protein
MMSSNLPPGCSVSDIPGNRPEDAEWEEMNDCLFQVLDQQGFEALVDKVLERVHEAYNAGYSDGEKISEAERSEES